MVATLLMLASFVSSCQLQVQTLYNRLSSTTGTIFNIASVRVLMRKIYKLLEEMPSNNYQQPSEKSMLKIIIGVRKIDVITTLLVQVMTLSNKLGSVNINVI